MENTNLSYVGILPDTEVGNALRNYHDQARDEYGNVALSAHEEIPANRNLDWTGVTVVVPEMTYSTYYVKKDKCWGKKRIIIMSEVGYVPAYVPAF